MSDFLLPFILGAGALGYALWLWKAHQEAAPVRRLNELTRQARAELPPVQLHALSRELREIVDIEEQLKLEGVAPDVARRMSLEAGIQSVSNHIALNRMLPG